MPGAERLKALCCVDDVDPVAHLEASHERQHLVGREIERVEHEAELLVRHQRKEAERAFARPLHPHRLASPPHLGFDVPGALLLHADREPVPLEQRAVLTPARGDRGLGVVKEVEIPRQARRAEQLVERCRSGDVALAARHAMLR
jgi:hypothetical protein